MNRKKLLSIGEVAKLTDASIHSLRYYERIKILNPAHIDPDSGYRYYSFEQIILIKIIMVCVELDIPLKELTRFSDSMETIDYVSLLDYGKEIAQKKLKGIERAIKFIEDMKSKIIFANKYHQGQELYKRHIPEKTYYVTSYEQSFENTDPLEIVKIFMAFDYRNIEYDGELIEYGLMCEYSPSGIRRYAFIEIETRSDMVETKIIPGGTYFCKLNDEISIEKSPMIFGEQLNAVDNFLAIETMFFSSRYEVSKPISELRVIAQS